MLAVENAEVTFPGGTKALNDVSINVSEGETVAVVGESGCGKTTLARAILGLQKLSAGRIVVDGNDVDGVRHQLAKHIGMVWQDPYASIDPRWTIARIIEEPWQITGTTGDLDALMSSCGLNLAYKDRYPHQLSGGQRQRVAIARALALRPRLVICDEPTAALDLSVQAQILNLLQDLKRDTGCAFLYISHDLGTVQYLADRVYVMWKGKVIEHGETQSVFNNPQQPYTKALLAAMPQIEELGVIPGKIDVPEAAI